MYRQVLHHNSMEERVKGIKHLLQTSFHGHSDTNYLIEYVNLLEKLSRIIVSDANNTAIVSRQGKTGSPKLSPTSSVLDALFYLNFFHFGEPEDRLSSPAALKKVHKLTDKQAVWVATTARASR